MERQSGFQLVDLHTHVFMEHGMGMLFQGGFDTPLRSSHWSDRFSSQINAATLETSNLGIVVVALYAHPAFALARRDSIRAQIRAAEDFVAKHPNWIIAKSPEEASAAIHSGKRCLILSIEGAAGIIDTEADMKEFIDEKGVRIVTFAHLTDDHLTGAAFMKGYKMLGSPTGMLRSMLFGMPKKDGVYVNPAGLTSAGRYIASKLIKRKVWIDLAHSPEETAKALVPLLKKAGQPLLYTHTALRDHHRAEREISREQLASVKESGGIVGLIPSDEVMGETPVSAGHCPSVCRETCQGSAWALAEQYEKVAKVIGAENVYLGTDFNGAMQHLKPTSCATGTSIDRGPGLYTIGQTPEVWFLLGKAGAPIAASAFHGADHFIAKWARFYPH